MYIAWFFSFPFDIGFKVKIYRLRHALLTTAGFSTVLTMLHRWCRWKSGMNFYSLLVIFRHPQIWVTRMLRVHRHVYWHLFPQRSPQTLFMVSTAQVKWKNAVIRLRAQGAKYHTPVLHQFFQKAATNIMKMPDFWRAILWLLEQVVNLPLNHVVILSTAQLRLDV